MKIKTLLIIAVIEIILSYFLAALKWFWLYILIITWGFIISCILIEKNNK